MKFKNKFSVDYKEVVSQFLEVTKVYVDDYKQISRPCKRCMNSLLESLEGVERYLLTIGISPSFTDQVYHGELVCIEVYKDLIKELVGTLFMKELAVTIFMKKMNCWVCLMIYKLRLNMMKKQRKVWRMNAV